jgi:hypothetical protein
LRVLVVLAALAAIPVAPAGAVNPETEVGGNGSKWYSGSLLSQTGLNCSTAIIGNAYTEIMVSGVAGYGGAPGGSVPKVGQPYWTSFLVSIPGNPCGSGSSNVVTTLILPPDTSIDTSRQIRCFGQGRTASTFSELTGQSWSFLGSSGPYCPSQASAGFHQGGNQIGFRPLANGQLFWIFVPVKSSSQLIGAGGPSPGHGFTWLTDSTGVYANPGRSFVWANVLPNGGSGGTPFIYFARDPTTIPFWKDDAPNDPTHPTMPGITTKSRAEWFANLYSGFKQGTFCWELHYGAPDDPAPVSSCPPGGYPGWNGAVELTGDSWYVLGSGAAAGPNGGYSPFYYDDDPPGTNFTIRWKFIYQDGGQQTVFKDTSFTTLAGPDQDGDGVANNGTDACPGVKGTLPNGCLPAVQEDPDKDGVYGAADLCPNGDGGGALNGCPGGIVPDIPQPPKQPDPPSPSLVATLLTRSGAVFKSASLAKGAPVKFECTVDSQAEGTLSIAARVAKKLGIKTKKKQKTVGIAKGKGQCKAGSGGSLRLKVLRAHAAKVRKAKKGFPASLAVKLTAPGQTAVTVKRGVKVR